MLRSILHINDIDNVHIKCQNKCKKYIKFTLVIRVTCLVGYECFVFIFRRAKDLIQSIIQRGQGGPDPNSMGDSVVEVMVPGNKVGLVIGKGGETIRQLQVNA